MSTYKVIQDIEAEDKILGPLTLKQFIAALVAAFFGYLCFISLTKGAAFLLAIFLPPAMLAAFFAFPFGKDQPTEVWAAAKFQFLFKPRRRIWDQSGVKDLVTITVPKKIERVYTDGLSQSEVRSRLHALADTIDSRGWAVKGVGASAFSQNLAMERANVSDRLVSVNSIPRAVPDYQVPASADMLDEKSSPLAQQFTQMITASEQAHRKQLIDELNGVRQAAPAAQQNAAWFGTPQAAQPMAARPVQDAVAVPTAAELEVIERAKATQQDRQQANAHLHTIQPLSSAAQQTAQVAAVPVPQPLAPAMTAPPSPAIISLANNNDLNIATLAREAQKAKEQSNGTDEVVVSLR